MHMMNGEGCGEACVYAAPHRSTMTKAWMRARSTILALFSAAALAAQVVAQEAAPPAADDSSAAIDEVIVRGRRMSEIDDDLRIVIKDFIGEVVSKPPGRGYARWHDRVCVGVHNLPTNAAQYLIDRISSLVLEVGLTVGEPGCAPDVVIVFATDANFVATYMVGVEPMMFRPAGQSNNDMTLSRAQLDEFTHSDRAVRWWHVSLPVYAHSRQPAIILPGASGSPWSANSAGAPVDSVQGPSRIHDGIVDELQRVIVVVDASKLKGTTWQQIADYLAVVSLAQIDPDTNPAAFDSILNLFTNPAAYSGLTDWDRSYVRALYEFDQERSPDLQTNALAGEMVRDPVVRP